jgi:hypothetical protein
MTTLSERLAVATELTPELREECAQMLGWERNSMLDAWRTSKTAEWQAEPPELHLGEIVVETRRIWLWLVPSIDGVKTRIRKFSHGPFPEGVEYVPAYLATTTAKDDQ